MFVTCGCTLKDFPQMSNVGFASVKTSQDPDMSSSSNMHSRDGDCDEASASMTRNLGLDWVGTQFDAMKSFANSITSTQTARVPQGRRQRATCCRAWTLLLDQSSLRITTQSTDNDQVSAKMFRLLRPWYPLEILMTWYLAPLVKRLTTPVSSCRCLHILLIFEQYRSLR